MIEAAKTFEKYIQKENITGFQIREAGGEASKAVVGSQPECASRLGDVSAARNAEGADRRLAVG